MVRRIVYIVLIVAGFAGISYWGYLQYVKIKVPRVTALEAIGEDVVFFIRVNDIRASMYKLFKESGFWPELAHEEIFHRWEQRFREIDSLLSRHPELNEIVELNPFLLSCQKTSGNSYGFIHLFELPPGETAPVLEDFIRSEYGKQSIVLKKRFRNTEIFTVNLTGPEALYYFCVFKGLYIGSFNETLVQQSIAQIKSRKSWLRDDLFMRVHATAGKNVDGNVYLHLPHFYSWIRQLVPTEPSPFEGWKVAGYWLEFDILFQPEALLLSGYTITPDSANSLLDGYSFPPGRVNIPEILPQGINWMVNKALLQKPGTSPMGDSSAILAMQDKYAALFGIDLEADLIPWLGDEVASVHVQGQDPSGDTLVVIHTEDAVQAMLSMQKMQRNMQYAGKKNSEEEIYLDYPVRRFSPASLFREFFGDHFPVISDGYYIAIKDYLVFSKQKRALKNVIDQFYEQKTFNEYGNYPSFSDNLSDQSNLYFYSRFDPVNASILPEQFLLVNPGLKHLLASVDAAALQFSYFNQMFYTNAFVAFQPETEPRNLADRNILLDGMVVMKPGIVPNHRSGKKNLLISDAQNTLYLIDHVGRVQWKLALVEKPNSDFYPIDFYGNDKIQYLFNTENYVYLVDLNGNYVADYPKKIPAPASGPMTVLDYASDGHYRILIPLRDNKIYCFDKNFEPVDGWQSIRAPGAVQTPVQHIVSRGRDYLFCSDSSGSVVVANRRGNERIRGPIRIKKAKNSDFFVNRTNNKGSFLTTNRYGELMYISDKGNTAKTDFGRFSPDHHFFYTDFNGDDHHDFIYADQDSLIVFNRFKEVILNRSMEGNMIRYAQIGRWGGRVFIAVLLEPSGEIRIYDEQGVRFNDQGLLGSIPFVISSLEDGQLYLFTGQGRQVLKYRLD